MAELVSIIMPSYNTCKFIKQSIESVLNQTYDELELIIVDDCSTDNTDKVIASFDDPRIIYLKNKVNSGAAVSRNRALREAKGKWIAFLDSDDVWHPEKLKIQLEFMKKNKYNFSYHAYEEMDEISRLTGKIVKGPQKITKPGMYCYCWPGCLTVMYNSEVTGLIQIADLKKNNDYALWLKIIKKSDCYFMNKSLARYRVRSGSISHHSKFKLIRHHYFLYRIGENYSLIKSVFFTVLNMFCGVYKKFMFVNTVKTDEKNRYLWSFFI